MVPLSTLKTPTANERMRNRWRQPRLTICCRYLINVRSTGDRVILAALARMAEQAPAYIYLAFVFAYGTQA